MPAGLPSASNVRRVLVPGDGNHTILMVVRWWQGNYINAVFRSTNAGASFSNVLNMSTYEGDLWAPRDGAGPLYALGSSGLLVSNNGGNSWTLAGSLPVSSTGGELAGSEAGAPRFWAIVEDSGKKLYRSDNAGSTWSFVTVITDYWGSLNASTVDPDLFAWGGVEVHVTRNAGASFDIVNSWAAYYGNEADRLHADVPGIDVVPDGLGGETWYVSTDGGLYESDDGLNTVSNLSLSGLSVSQYYSTHTSTANSDNVLAGAQDQGWQRADQPPTGSDTTLFFDQLISGDYGHITSSDGDHDYVYTVYPGFLMMNVGETNPALYMEDFPAGETYSWLPSVVADPTDEETVFFCANHLWRYSKAMFGNSWNLTQHSTQNFAISGGEHLTGLVFSPLNSNRVHAVSNQGRLWHSADHGLNWTQSTSTGPNAHYFYGTTMAASTLDLDTVYVGGSGYGSPAVYRSTDGGVSYQPWGQGLPDTLVYGLVESPDGSGAMFCGTETGAWMRGPTDAAWIDIAQNDAPITRYWSVEAVPSEGVVRFGTYGRGIWDYAVSEPCDWEAYELAQGGANVLNLDSGSSTVMGQSMQFDLSGALPGASGYMLVSTGAASLPAKGGTLLVSQVGWLLVNLTANGAGTLQLPASVPVDPSLDGLDVYLQAVMQDAGQTGGWAFSNGLTGALRL